MSKSINNTFVEVCAGAGGLSLGLIKAGWIPILLNDNNKDCIETLKMNHNNINIVKESFEKLDYEYIKNLNPDLLCGGVPCQSFSLAGNKNGLDDLRGDLFIKFINMIDYVRPKIFLIENVEGLTIHNNGKTFKYLLDKLNNINFNISYKVLNSNDYDVPQNRHRLFIIGLNKDVFKDNIYFQFY